MLPDQNRDDAAKFILKYYLSYLCNWMFGDVITAQNEEGLYQEFFEPNLNLLAQLRAEISRFNFARIDNFLLKFSLFP